MALTVRGCPGAPRGVAPRSDPVANHHSQQPTYPSNPHHLKSPNTHHQTQTYPAHHPQPAGIWTPPYHLPGNSRRSSHHRDTAPLRGGGSLPLYQKGDRAWHQAMTALTVHATGPATHPSCAPPVPLSQCPPKAMMALTTLATGLTTGHDSPNGACCRP